MDSNEAAKPPLTQSIETAMKAAGLSEVALCEKAGIARTTFRRHMATGDTFDLRQLAGVARALDMKVSALLAHAETPAKADAS